MTLLVQIKVILYTFMYSLISYYFYYKIKNIVVKFIYLPFCTSIYYYLLYKINGGIINVYTLFFVIIGLLFCKVFYFDKKNN